MKAWQGIFIVGLAGWLVACGQHGSIQQDVKVQRGEIVARAPTVPFIQVVSQPSKVATIPEAPEVAKPKQNLPDALQGTENTGVVKPAKFQTKFPEPGKIGEYTVIGFDRLASFAYEVPDDPITEPKAKAIIDKNEIPKRVTKYNKQKVAIKGYMLPLRVQDGKITELLILRDQSMCCYGAVPKINEWVSVRMPEGKGVKPIMDVPITFFGTLKVGEVLENGYLVGIYEMDGHRIGGPIDL
jgi:hypothetical protein